MISTVNLNKYLSKRVLIAIAFLILFTTGTILILTVPFSVKITYNLYVQTDDGVTIYFNLFEPVGRETEKKPAVIIAHGVMANKEFMKGYAIELAAAGFAAIALDFRGHGQSTGFLDSSKLTYDINAILDFLNTTPPTAIDMNNLGYIGYSMGGFPGNIIVNTSLNFKCFIGVGTILDPNLRIGNSSYPLNVLMIEARFDETFGLPELVTGLAPRTGKSASEIDLNKLYGNFEDGNASMIYLDDNSDHLLTAWDQDFIRASRDWVINTFSVIRPDIRPADENFYTNYRLLILTIQVIGGLGLFFVVVEPLSKLILKSRNKKELKTYQLEFRNTSEKKLILLPLLYSLTIVLPLVGMLVMSPLLFTPLNIVALVLMIFFGQTFAFLIFLWRTAKKDELSLRSLLTEPFKDQKTNLLRHVIIGSLLAVILYTIIYLSVGLNYLGIVPSIIKIPWMFLFFTIYLIIGFIINIVFIGIKQMRVEDNLKGLFKSTFVVFGYLAIYTVFYILLFCFLLRNFFMLLFIIIILPILLLTASINVISYAKTGNILVGSIISAFLQTCIATTLSPLAFGLFALFT